MRKKQIRNILLAVVAAILVRNGAFAQDSTVLSDRDVSDRLGFVETSLRTGQSAARLWAYGWIGTYSAATAVQWSLAGAHWNDKKWDNSAPVPRQVRDRGLAEDMLVGGATTALGVGGFLIDPFLPATALNRFRRLADTTPEDRRIKLAKAEELLRLCAERERRGRGRTTHLLNIGVNAVAGIVTAAAFHRPVKDGLMTFVIGEAVSLINIFTQPRKAIRAWHNYQVRFQKKPGAMMAGRPDRKWYFSAYPGGIRIGLNF
jgi:hypothetical protein